MGTKGRRNVKKPKKVEAKQAPAKAEPKKK
jgi:hypothetical protein